jgi:hypothetical protein
LRRQHRRNENLEGVFLAVLGDLFDRRQIEMIDGAAEGAHDSMDTAARRSPHYTGILAGASDDCLVAGFTLKEEQMKRLLAVALTVLGLSVAVQGLGAQTPAPAAKAPAPAKTTKAKAMTASGTVKSVTGTQLVVDSSGKDMTFTVDGSTKFVGKGLGTKSRTGKLTAQDAVGAGDAVSVTYHDMGGTMHAASVRITNKGAMKK